MIGDSSFMHSGLTVLDINRTVAFYKKYFGFEVKVETIFSPEFIAAKESLYRQPEGTFSKMAMISSPNGISLELFEFCNAEQAKLPEWNKTGYHHIALKVSSVPEFYERMKEDGVEFFFPPSHRGNNPEAYWVFCKDPDGNMLELQD